MGYPKVCLGVVLLSCNLSQHSSTKHNKDKDKDEEFLNGIDVLQRNRYARLSGRKVGVVVNPASVNRNLHSTAELLEQSSEVEVVALFGPEHGVYGDEYAGVYVSDRVSSSGIPIYSLFGKTKRPTKRMLSDMDTVVFDLQGIGSRSYTFVGTLKAIFDACVEHELNLVILDRPNPLGGIRVEGPNVEPGYISFLSPLNIPYLHGMTMGELALLIRDRHYPHYQKLDIVAMEGWSRDMLWEDTKREWIPTSPHIPHVSSSYGYAATGIVGEILSVSNGVGYTLPFEIVGTPWLDEYILAQALNSYWKDASEYYKTTVAGKESELSISAKPSGIYFRPVRFKPYYAAYKKELCRGVQVHIDPRDAENIIEINYRLLEIFRVESLLAESKKTKVFDLINGSPEPRQYLLEGKPLEELFSSWREKNIQFKLDREKYLIYK